MSTSFHPKRFTGSLPKLVISTDSSDNVESWIQTNPNLSRRAALDPGYNFKAILDDLLISGYSLQITTVFRCFYETWRRVTGYSAPIVVFIVREISSFKSRNFIGCSLGPLSDYVVVEAKNPKCIAHEIAHACNLWHSSNNSNLMRSNCGGKELYWWQKALLRISRHVTCF